MPSITATWSPGPGRDYVTLASGFDSSVFEYFEKQPTAGWQIDFNTSEITFSDLAVIEPVNDFEGDSVIYAFDPETGLLHGGEVIASQLEEANPVTQAPQGTITLGTATKDSSSISQPFTYSLSDADSFEYRVDGGTWQTVTSPITLTGLTADTAYLIEVRSVNSEGYGSTASTTVTTDEEVVTPTVPQGTITFGTVTRTSTTFSLPITYSLSDVDSFEYRVDDGSWIEFTSPISLTGLSPETTYGIDVRPVNATGVGTIVSTTVTTIAASSSPLERVIALSASISSMPTNQSFTMYQGDRVKFTVDHSLDMTDKVMVLRVAPAEGATARLSVNANNDEFLFTSEMSESFTTGSKVWQIIVKQGDERVVVADGKCTVKPRIKLA